MNIQHPPYTFSTQAEQVTFRMMGFGTYGTGTKTIGLLAVVLGVLFTLSGVGQLIQTGNFVGTAFVLFGLIDLAGGVRLLMASRKIKEAEQYRLEHNGTHPKDTVFIYNSTTQVLTQEKNQVVQVLHQGSAPTFTVRKTSSRGGFAGHLFTLHWNGGSSIVTLGQTEEEKNQIEQELRNHDIQLRA